MGWDVTMMGPTVAVHRGRSPHLQQKVSIFLHLCWCQSQCPGVAADGRQDKVRIFQQVLTSGERRNWKRPKTDCCTCISRSLEYQTWTVTKFWPDKEPHLLGLVGLLMFINQWLMFINQWLMFINQWLMMVNDGYWWLMIFVGSLLDLGSPASADAPCMDPRFSANISRTKSRSPRSSAEA